MTDKVKPIGPTDMTVAEFITEIWPRLRDHASAQFALPRVSGGHLNFIIAFVGTSPDRRFPDPPLNFTPPAKGEIN